MIKFVACLLSCILLFGGSEKVGVVPHQNSLEQSSKPTYKEFKKYYNTRVIRTLSGLNTPELDIKVMISCGDEFVVTEDTVRWFDISRDRLKTNSKVPVSNAMLGDEETSYTSILTIEDGESGRMFQTDNDSEWFMQESNPFNIYSRFSDYSFETLCGKMWYIDSETDTDIILTRSIENGINSDFISATYMGMFSGKNLNFTRHESQAVIDKKSKRFKSYVESVSFLTDKLGSEPEYTADDGLIDYVQAEYKVTVTIDLEPSSIGVDYLPEDAVVKDVVESTKIAESESEE